MNLGRGHKQSAQNSYLFSRELSSPHLKGCTPPWAITHWHRDTKDWFFRVTHVSSFICFCQSEPIRLGHSAGPSLTIASPLALSFPHRLVVTFNHCYLLEVLGFISQSCPCLLDYIWNMLPAHLEQALSSPQVVVLLGPHCIKHSLPHSSPIILSLGGTSEAVHPSWANTSFKQFLFLSSIFNWWLDTWSHKQNF